jgi:tRNA threonylcarbamoyladenosine modification (KEOPS) complex Cgi121 subunit
MLAIFGSSHLGKEELEKVAKEEGILLLNPKKVNSHEELLLAEKLAKNAIREKRAIAKKEEAEFLLWLSAKTNIKSAFEAYAFQKPGELLLISLKSAPLQSRTPNSHENAPAKPRLLKRFGMEEKEERGLKKDATPAEIERISLSRA